MRKYVDYRKAYEQEDTRIPARCIDPIQEKSAEKIRLAEQILQTNLEQYRFRKDEKKRKRLEHRHYPVMCALARSHGSRVELDIDEVHYYATLTYIGTDLILDNIEPIEMQYFLQIMTDCDTVTFEAENNCICIQFTFEMNRKEKVKDNSQTLRELKNAYNHL